MHNLVEIIHRSNSILDTRGQLEKQGVVFKNLPEFIYLIDEEWRKAIDINQINLIDKLESWPIKIRKNNTDYYIYGLIHGLGMLTPSKNPQEQVLNYVNKLANSLHNPDVGIDYFYEENLHETFNFLEENQLKDYGSTLYNKKPNYLHFLMAFAAIINIFPFFMLYDAWKTHQTSKIVKPKNFDEMRNYLEYWSTRNPIFLPQYSQFEMAVEMPQPIDLEKFFLTEKTPSGRIVNALYMEPNMATTPERSLWTARNLLKISHEKKLREVHYFCGSSHVSQIAYFILHPDYSFEHLERFKNSFN